MGAKWIIQLAACAAMAQWLSGCKGEDCTGTMRYEVIGEKRGLRFFFIPDAKCDQELRFSVTAQSTRVYLAGGSTALASGCDLMTSYTSSLSADVFPEGSTLPLESRVTGAVWQYEAPPTAGTNAAAPAVSAQCTGKRIATLTWIGDPRPDAGVPDVTVYPDAERADARFEDAEHRDAGGDHDAEQLDAEQPDAEQLDAQPEDGGSRDALEAPDADSEDAPPTDLGMTDTGTAAPASDAAEPADAGAPEAPDTGDPADAGPTDTSTSGDDAG